MDDQTLSAGNPASSIYHVQHWQARRALTLVLCLRYNQVTEHITRHMCSLWYRILLCLISEVTTCNTSHMLEDVNTVLSQSRRIVGRIAYWIAIKPGLVRKSGPGLDSIESSHNSLCVYYGLVGGRRVLNIGVVAQE
jgi:hypothetical protein